MCIHSCCVVCACLFYFNLLLSKCLQNFTFALQFILENAKIKLKIMHTHGYLSIFIRSMNISADVIQLVVLNALEL